MTTVEPDPEAPPHGDDRLAELGNRIDGLEERLRALRSGTPSAGRAGRLALDVLAATREADDLAAEMRGNGASPVAPYQERLEALVDPLAALGVAAADAETPPPAPERRRATERRAARAALVRSLLGQALTLVGVLLALFLLYQLVLTDLSASLAQRALREEFTEDLLSAGQVAIGLEEGESSLDAFGEVEGIGEDVEAEEFDVEALKDRLTQPGTGQPIAILSIPTIGLKQYVVEGSGSTQLAQGPGHYRGSPRPGYIGNSVIAGHRTTYGAPFRELDQLEDGDNIKVTTVDGIFHYTVRGAVTIRPGQDDVTGPKFENLLTLVTSSPPYRADHRLAVVAELEDTPVVPDDDLLIGRNPAIATDELGVFRNTTAWTPAVIYFQLLAGAWILAKVLTARWRRWSAWLITAPLLFTFGFLFLESAARLLPSTY